MSKIHIISIKNIHKSYPNISIKRKIISNKIMHAVLALAHTQEQLEMVLPHPPPPQLPDAVEKVPARSAHQAAEKVAASDIIMLGRRTRRARKSASP